MSRRISQLLIGAPTRNLTGHLIGYSMLHQLGAMFGVSVHFAFGKAGNIPRSRNQVMDAIRRMRQPGDTHMLWWDVDIVPQDVTQVASMISWALEQDEDVAVTANYRMANMNNVVMKNREFFEAPHLTDQEIENLPDVSEIGMCGMGLLFAPIDDDYIFHADIAGEDVYYFREHPDLKLYLDKRVQVRHCKEVELMNPVGGVAHAIQQ